MNTPQHTPGPWNYWPTIKGRFSIYANGPLAYSAGVSDYGDAAEANAHLIASAPDLLDLLEAAVARVQIANEEGNSILSAWLPDALSALAKAKGDFK
jgi:hypothetical protein